MRFPKFYHSIFPVLLLVCNVGAAAPSLAENDMALSEALPVVPPRSINDITRMLTHYKQRDDVLRNLLAVADAPEPVTDERKTLFNFYWRRGLAAAELGRVQQQIADLTKAVSFGQTGAVEYARALRNLAGAEALGGNFANALHYLNEAIKQIPESSMGMLTGAYGQVIGLAAAVGDFETAELNMRLLESTMQTLRSRRGWGTWSHFWLASTEKARGEFFRISGKMSEAEGAYRRSLRETQAALLELPALLQSGTDAPTPENLQQNIEAIERGLAQVLLAQGKVIDAEAMARNALEHTLKRAGQAAPDVGRGLRVLADVIAEQGRYSEAEILSQAALAAVLASGAASDSLGVLSAQRANLAAQVAQGKYAEALRTYELIKAAVADKPALAERALRGDLDVVQALIRTGQAKAAEQMAGAMLLKVQAQQGDLAPRTAEVRAFHAIALADLGDQANALAGFKKSLAVLLERARNDSETESGSIRRQQRLITIVERYIQLLVDLQEKGGLPAGLDPANESFTLADLARGSSVQRALTRSAARAAIKDPALADLARQEQEAQRRGGALESLLGQLLSAPPEQQLPAIQAKIRSDIERLKKSRDQFKGEISKRFPEYAQLVDPPAVDLFQVRKMLQPGELLVSWYFGEEGSYVWAVAANGQRRFARLPGNRQALVQEIDILRRALNPDAPTIEQMPAFDVALAHRLYLKLFSPVVDLLADSNLLLAVPHAELGQLPLSLLVSAPVSPVAKSPVAFTAYRHVPWLMRKLAIAQLPSVTSLASLRQLPAASEERLPFIGFGDPYFSQEQAAQAEKPATNSAVAMRGVPLKLRNVPNTRSVDSAELALLPRLPDTAQEIREIAKTLGAVAARDVFLQRAASEKSVFETDLSNRRVVMFATHGLIPGELNGLSQPALALSAPGLAGSEGDGLLTQEEILSLKLNADWVVLSACNTAAGEGSGSEAVSGLGRAFFYAGARALLVSNWPVETEAARHLMTDLFKRQSVAPGMSKAEALRQAMLGLVDGPGRVDEKTGKSLFSYAHPLFWAPFVLVGD